MATTSAIATAADNQTAAILRQRNMNARPEDIELAQAQASVQARPAGGRL